MNEPKRDGLGLEDKYLAEKNVCADNIGRYYVYVWILVQRLNPKICFILNTDGSGVWLSTSSVVLTVQVQHDDHCCKSGPPS